MALKIDLLYESLEKLGIFAWLPLFHTLLLRESAYLDALPSLALNQINSFKSVHILYLQSTRYHCNFCRLSKHAAEQHQQPAFGPLARA